LAGSTEMSKQTNITDEELQEILQLLLHQYGYDFLNYTSASLKRRILHFMDAMRIINIYDLKFNLTNHKGFFTQFLQTVTVNTTGMFRDPLFYKTVSEKIIPELATYPIIKIWHAGCATGEEAFSLSILLHEAQLLNRCLIYATDLNAVNLERASKGIIARHNLTEYMGNYHEAGGKNDFFSYYTARNDYLMLNREVRTNIVFSSHNLVSDSVFNEFQLILCRNVLIYFNSHLQNKVVNLLYDSLSPLGYLALGTKESLLFTDLRSKFDCIYPAQKIFKRR
jgi:chemotaxis protein methyltransferase CheR